MLPAQAREAATLLLMAALLACGGRDAETGTERHFVGSARCAACHPAETALWRGSHHDLATQEAVPGAVLGRWDDAGFEHGGTIRRFQRAGDRWRVVAEDETGASTDHEVAWVLGVEPLQQVLLPRPGGRFQALQVAWDARPRGAGGQRWYALDPERSAPPGDVLHWTGAGHTWNRMCVDCHSTGVDRGFDLETLAFDTTFSELDVACEACHGPGSTHVEWAEGGGEGEPQLVALGARGGFRFIEGEAIARRDAPRTEHREIEVCAPCHSRRTQLAQTVVPGRAFLDDFRPAFLDPGLYFDDGQMNDEVYVWGSFVQSAMHRAGVTCSDCHDPHALRIEDPDAACAACHRPEVFATPAHHRHPPESTGASCVGCHMPARTYMGIDARRDHSLRVPRPDVSERIGSPDACTGCHGDRDVAWAAAQARLLWPGGRTERNHFADAFHGAATGDPSALRTLVELAGDSSQPPIVRASATARAAALGPEAAAAIGQAARDEDPLPRLAAAIAARVLPPPQRSQAIGPLLGDPMRSVRIAAAGSLAALARSDLPRDVRRRLDTALDEFRAAQHAQAHTPEAHANLGVLHSDLGEAAEAESAYRTAIRVGSWFVPAYLNLADLYRAQGRDPEGERLLREAIAIDARSANARHALGLLLVRADRLEEAIPELRAAAELAPRVPYFAAVHRLALEEWSRRRER